MLLGILVDRPTSVTKNWSHSLTSFYRLGEYCPPGCCGNRNLKDISTREFDIVLFLAPPFILRRLHTVYPFIFARLYFSVKQRLLIISIAINSFISYVGNFILGTNLATGIYR